jgi:hypothetical protein
VSSRELIKLLKGRRFVMSVKKRVATIFHRELAESYYGDFVKQKLAAANSLRYRFKPRVPELRGLEGVYENPTHPTYPIHISCRFNDILRAGDSKNFFSCFRPKGSERLQPFLRCSSNEWAIIFVRDKSGKFMGRTWLNYSTKEYGKWVYDHNNIPTLESKKRDTYSTYKIYGNKLEANDVRNLLYKLIPSLGLTNPNDLTTGRQVQYMGGCADDYLPFQVD